MWRAATGRQAAGGGGGGLLPADAAWEEAAREALHSLVPRDAEREAEERRHTAAQLLQAFADAGAAVEDEDWAGARALA